MHQTFIGFTALFSLLFCIAAPAYADEAILPIAVTLVKCGELKSDIPRACKADERCCVFMDQAPKINLAILDSGPDYRSSRAKLYDLADSKPLE